jgi:hypothetical protein
MGQTGNRDYARRVLRGAQRHLVRGGRRPAVLEPGPLGRFGAVDTHRPQPPGRSPGGRVRHVARRSPVRPGRRLAAQLPAVALGGHVPRHLPLRAGPALRGSPGAGGARALDHGDPRVARLQPALLRGERPAGPRGRTRRAPPPDHRGGGWLLPRHGGSPRPHVRTAGAGARHVSGRLVPAAERRPVRRGPRGIRTDRGCGVPPRAVGQRLCADRGRDDEAAPPGPGRCTRAFDLEPVRRQPVPAAARPERDHRPGRRRGQPRPRQPRWPGAPPLP